MGRGDHDVAVYVDAPRVRIVITGTRLEVHTSANGYEWRVLLQTDAGEATPIVSRVLKSLRAASSKQR